MNIDNLLFLDDFLTTIMGFNTNGNPNNNLLKVLIKQKYNRFLPSIQSELKLWEKR